MTKRAAAEFIPLEADSQGVLRISGTHVTLESVVAVYRTGRTAEQIAELYSSLQLADIYAVLTYYLRHQEEVETYIRRHHRQVDPAFMIDQVASERSEPPSP